MSWDVLDEPLSPDFARAVAADHELLRCVAVDGRSAVARVWQAGPALVVGTSITRRARYLEAASTLCRDGWPCVARSTGGTCVPLHRGILNLSLVVSRNSGEPVALDWAYRHLADASNAALAHFGITFGLGSVPGSFCDGRFNFVAADRKLAGTAQRWMRGGDGRPAVLVHAALTVRDAALSVSLVNRFETLSDGPDRYAPECHTSVEELIGSASSSSVSPVCLSNTDPLTEVLIRRIEQCLERD